MKQLPIIDPESEQPARRTDASVQSGDTLGSYAFVSLGCPKNLVDSERMLGALSLEGYTLVAEPSGADFAIVNTCGFIEEARTESFGAIDEMLELKRQGKLGGVIVSGCLAERQKEALLEARPEIDHLVGVFARDEVTKVADRLLGRMEEQRTIFRPAPSQPLGDRGRWRITPRHFAYLKISEGCDRLCTFCAIPKMRGKHASKPIEEIIAEARELVEDGVRELIIVAQDTTYYGMDLYGRPRLDELLEQLDAIEGLKWIRLMYFYPMYVNDRVIEVIAGAKHILPYIDIPLQHINDNMLKRMQRRVPRKETESLLAKMRKMIPNLVLRTTFITGFPGETDEAFDELLAFVEEQQFDRMGVFTYSLEPDTPAARLPEHLPEDLKQERRAKLMSAQQKIAFARCELQVGKQMEVVIDHPVPEEDGVFMGRTMADAPDVDSVVFVTGHDLAAGQFRMCEIVATKEYDLIAVPVDQEKVKAEG